MKSNGLAALVLALAATISFASDAQAVEVNGCTVGRVAYDGSPRVAIDCGGTFYYGYGSAWSGCSNTVSVDTLKTWESMAASALLSGKRLNIGYVTQTGSCATGAKTLTHVDIVN